MLHAIEYIVDHERNVIDGCYFYGTTQQAQRFANSEFGFSNVIEVVQEPELLNQWENKGLPLGIDVFGNHSFQDGSEYIRV